MSTIREVVVPGISDTDDVTVIEILVAAGDVVSVEDSLLTLESSKATMEVPSPYAGIVKELKVEEEDNVVEGQVLLILEETAQEVSASPEHNTSFTATSETTLAQAESQKPSDIPQSDNVLATPSTTTNSATTPNQKPHASPSVHRFARELGVDLTQVACSGPAGRILQADIQEHVKRSMTKVGAESSSEEAYVDYSKFGEIETQPLSHIENISSAHLQHSWSNIPHVTQFDEADITDLEAFRKEHLEDEALRGFKLTLLAFIMKACVVTLKKFPRFNASLDSSGKNIILKKYFHIGFAVDTDMGLMVPVVRNVDQKGLLELAAELGELSQRTRKQQLKAAEMQGGSFTISSLGSIGGTAFTPIINSPEAAILGVSRAAIKPLYQYGDFSPRLILPFSLSYDHRFINGADAARFTYCLVEELSDIRKLIL